MTVLLTGGTGFVGSYVVSHFLNNNDTIRIITRTPEKYTSKTNVSYHRIEELPNLIDSVDVVINLAGANLFDQRWTGEVKKAIIESRVGITQGIVNAINQATHKPRVLISASAVGYYGDSGAKQLRESDPPGTDFLANVCVLWEKEAQKVDKSVRLVIPRIGIVLQKDDGALAKMLLPFKLGVGGPLGKGSQYFPWIHMQDLVRSFQFAIDEATFSGAYNACAPEPVTMTTFASVLGNVMHRPSFFSVPQFALDLLLGEAASGITASMRTLPTILQKAGFSFEFDNLEEALRDIV